MSSRQETGIGTEWLDRVKALAKAERDLGVRRWVVISIVLCEERMRKPLYCYELPVDMLERWEWAIRWRQARLQCQHPRHNIQRTYRYEYRFKGTCIGWQEDLKRLVSIKSIITRQKNNIQQYLRSQETNLFFDESNDEKLNALKEKISNAEKQVQLAEERLKNKLLEYEKSKDTNN